MYIHSTPPVTKKYAEILLHYMQQLFIKGDVFIGKRGIFGAEVFLHYRQFFVKSDFIIGGVECMCNVECYVLLQLMSLSQNEFYAETAAFTNAIDLALSL